MCISPAHQLVHIIALASGIAVRQSIMGDIVDSVLLQKLWRYYPWSVTNDLVHPPCRKNIILGG